MYCFVILKIESFSILSLCFLIKYKSKLRGFLKVFKMIFNVLGGMYKFLGLLIIVLLCKKVSGSFCCIGFCKLFGVLSFGLVNEVFI